MKKLVIFFAFVPFVSFAQKAESNGTCDTCRVSVFLELRYVFSNGPAPERARSASFGEIGSVPVFMKIGMSLEPFRKNPRSLKNFGFLYDGDFSQDRTSSELGAFFQKENWKFGMLYGIVLVREKEFAEIRAMSLNFDYRNTRSLFLDAEIDVLGVYTDVKSKLSYDGNGYWHYKVFASSMPFRLLGFNAAIFGLSESLFGIASGVSLANEKGSKIISGYVKPESRAENLYRRKEGIMIGLSHTWE